MQVRPVGLHGSHNSIPIWCVVVQVKMERRQLLQGITSEMWPGQPLLNATGGPPENFVTIDINKDFVVGCNKYFFTGWNQYVPAYT